MKTVLLSLHPKWWTKMLTGEKVIEVRKSKPLNIEPDGKVKVIVYVTGNVGVVGEFICDKFYKIRMLPTIQLDVGVEHINLCSASCLSSKELYKYAGKRQKPMWGWSVTKVKDYGHPKPLSEFGLSRPPQSWVYLNLD